MKGFFYGFLGGLMCLAITFIVFGTVYADDGRTGLRVSILITGLWWFVFTIPLIPFLNTRAGPPLPNLGIWYKLSFSLRRTIAMIRTLKHIPETRKFLIGYFLFSDCYSRCVC